MAAVCWYAASLYLKPVSGTVMLKYYLFFAKFPYSYICNNDLYVS